MKTRTIFVFALFAFGAAFAADPLLDGFRLPPHAAKPHTWWHWINGNVSKAGITADLEAMAAVGLGGAQMFDAGLFMPTGSVPYATETWYDHVVHAAREAKRLGLDLTLANCSGWTSSGGPWITPELAMKYVTNTAVRVAGGTRFDGALPLPPDVKGFYADIAVLAFPTPKETAAIPDFDRQVFRLRSAENGPIPPAPIVAFPAAACVAKGDVVVLTSRMDAGGRLAWQVPATAADWTILRIGYQCNGQKNRPASPSGSGLECDKLSTRAVDAHFDAYIGEVLKRVPPEARGEHGFNGVLLDSYEVHGQNWTQGFEREFKARAGYDITPWLPVLAGFPMESAAATDRFLRDFRRVIADLFAVNYAGRLQARCHANGLTFYCEPYGNGPSDDLQYGIWCDVPMSEFWPIRAPGYTLAGLARTPWKGRFMEARWGNRALGNGRTVASMAHVWGKPIVGAEAFTSYPTEVSGRWLQDPYALKAQGDRVFTDGVNRMIFHRYVHQPWTPARYPGMTMAHYGFHFERTITWWEHGAREWVGYLTRAQQLLQQGLYQADVLFWCGEEAPNFGTGGDVPPGYACDHCPTDVLDKLQVQDGCVVAPGGVRYRILGVPSGTCSARPAAELARLKAAGATVVPYGDVAAQLPPPDFTCDDRDVTWIHRRAGTDDIYFIANPNTNANAIVCSFRVTDKVAERWDAETGAVSALVAHPKDGRTEIVLDCAPADGIFVVFRTHPTAGARPAGTEARASCQEMEVRGPWHVTFRQTGEDADCAQADFPALVSWTTHGDEAIRFFSGTATYTQAAPLAFVRPPQATRVVLDLGDVKNIAEVTVNGRRYPALWKPPFRLDVTDAVAGDSGSLRLSVKVTNLWPNRLIGDAKKPADCVWSSQNRYRKPFPKDWPDWLLEGKPSPTGRRTFATAELWTAAEEPLPSGLLGPVKLVFR